ncbi:unnamed protein product [Ectocarpus sp. 12 AP-2014]
MASFPPRPPTPPRPRPPSEPSGGEGWSTERFHSLGSELVARCTEKYKTITRSSDHVGAPCVILGAMAMTAFAALGLVAALPMKGRGVLVNFWGFLVPALSTIGEIEKKADNKPLFTGYWVVFGLFVLLDGVLPAITPCYLSTKACVLIWAFSSARPYGGRPVLNLAFDINDGNDSDHKDAMVIKALRPWEEVATEKGISRKAFRLAAIITTVTAGTVVLGICSFFVLTVEGLYAGLSTSTQARVCVLAGACWPLYATLVGRARSEAAAVTEGSGGTEGAEKKRQGPAAVQWLSYWPMFALFLAVLDPAMGWLPHFYSFKMVALAFLALPQTRGAYLITSLVLYGNDPGTVGSGGGDEASSRGEQGEHKVSCGAPALVTVD